MQNAFIDKLRRFRALDESAISALSLATSRPRRIAARQDLIREGDRPGPMFVMLEGWACRYKILPNGTRQITAFLMPGDACDLNVGLLKEMDHSIQTLSPAKVVVMQKNEIDALMRAHHDFAIAMYIAQLTDEGILRAWITSIGRRSSIERVAHLTCELYVRARAIGLVEDVALDLPLSQTVLADALGMTPVHMNRVLRELREAGVMGMRRGSLTVLHPARLVDIAGFDNNYLNRRSQASAGGVGGLAGQDRRSGDAARPSGSARYGGW